MNYGFCLENNKYNSLSFRVWLDFNDKQKYMPKKNDEYNSEEEEEIAKNKICKAIRLKRNRLREDVFAYLRASLMQKPEHKEKTHLLVSTPVDAEFELLVVACAINLLQGLLNARFKSKIEEDKQLLKRTDISMRLRFAVQHRLDC